MVRCSKCGKLNVCPKVAAARANGLCRICWVEDGCRDENGSLPQKCQTQLDENGRRPEHCTDGWEQEEKRRPCSYANIALPSRRRGLWTRLICNRARELTHSASYDHIFDGSSTWLTGELFCIAVNSHLRHHATYVPRNIG